MFSLRTRRRAAAGFAIALIGLLAETASAATTHHVTSAVDDGMPGTLRYEIVHAAAGDSVDFQLLGCPCTITLTSGAISVYLPITIVGLGSTELTVSGNNSDRIFLVAATGGTRISGMELKDGIQAGGGAIAAFGDTTLVDIAFRHNRSFGLVGDDSFFGNGGALFVDSAATASVSSSTFEDNSAGPGNFAGAIDGEGAVHISDSAFVDNEANMCGAVSLAGASTVENSTFDANRTIGDSFYPSSGSGGAICTWTSGVSIVNSTIANNGATRAGGGLVAFIPATLANSVVADNVAPGGPDISGAIISKGFNLVSNRSGSSGYRNSACMGLGDFPADLPEQEPDLSPLHTVGRLSLLTPNPASPLIDAISVGGGPCDGFDVPSFDARGVARPYGTKADIGAVEFIPDDDRIFCDGLEGVACTALR